MPQIINTNIASINAQRSLDMSETSLQSALQHLSSGLRINIAKDDAAGLAFPNGRALKLVALSPPGKN